MKWPFRGNITIQLLNQLEDNDHRTETIPFTDETDDECDGRVTTGERDAGPVIPVTFTMDGFAQHKGDDDNWYSDPFYTTPHGYKMCLRVVANGSGKGEGTHISVFVYMMQGEFDDYLKWPFRGDITIQLLNQLEDKEHHSMTIPFTDDTVAGRVTTGESISHEELYKANGAKYLQKDCLQFQVTKVDLVLVFVFFVILVIISCLCCCLISCYLCCREK